MAKGDKLYLRDITGMRDRLIHDYMGVNVESVWKTVQVDLPELQRAVSSILGSDRRDG